MTHMRKLLIPLIFALALVALCLSLVVPPAFALTWTAQTSETIQTLDGVAYSGSQFVVVGSNGTILTSPDGATWTAQTSGTTNFLYSVAYGGGQFVAVGVSGTVLTSPDGATWTAQTSGTTESFLRVAYSGSQFVVVGSDGTILTSPDGATWTARTSGTTQNLGGVAYDGSQFVVVGWSGTILTSPDGATWTARTSGTTQLLRGVVYGGSQFVVVGWSGTILTSPDGVTWTSRTSGATLSLWSVGYGGNQFVVVGSDGTILTSPDGVTWTADTSGTTNHLYDVTYGDSQFVAVGLSGTILTSSEGPSLTLTKSVSPSSAKPGDPITYTISFSNTGAITATHVVITDALSANISNPNWDSSGVTLTPIGGQTYAWTAPDLLPGQGGVITITGVLTSPLAAGTIPNTVTMAISGTVRTANADLTVENVAPVANAGQDQSVSKDTLVTLSGSGTDANGDGLTYGWEQTGGSPTVTLSDATAQSPTFTAPSSDTVLTFTLTVTDTQDATDADEVVVTVSTPTDLSMDKSVQIANLTAVTYTLVAENLGPNPADGAVISDTLSNMTGAAWTCTAAGGAAPAPSSGTGDVQVTLSTFPVGGVVTCTVSGALVDWSYVSNTAEITAPAGVTDSDLNNNRATVERWQCILPVVFKNWTP